MPSAPQPASALRDRAERHVFAVLPQLPAIERRVRALLELAGEDRSAVAHDTGLEDVALRLAAQRARKALRRTRAPLPAGARCERAELLASDRSDGPLGREDRKWLEIHLARCPRCASHLALLDAARADLRATFAAEPPKALPPAPAPPAIEAPDDRARLRVVPPPPEPPPEPVGGETRLTDGLDGPTVAADEPRTPSPPRPIPEPIPPPPPVGGETRLTDGVDRPRARRWRRVAMVVAIVLAILAGLGAAVAALDADHDQHRTAPWDQPNAPEVRPAPLIDQ
jgi:hypothetical protein